VLYRIPFFFVIVLVIFYFINIYMRTNDSVIRYLLANTIKTKNIDADTIDADVITAKRMDIEHIITGTITVKDDLITDTVNANIIDATKVTSDNVTTDTFTANIIDAIKVTSDDVTTDTFTANIIDATKVTSGDVTADTVNANIIDATKVTSGDVISDTVKANTIETVNFTSDTINANTIVTAGNVTAGNVTADTLLVNSIDTTSITFNGTKLIDADNKLNSAFLSSTSTSNEGFFTSESHRTFVYINSRGDIAKFGYYDVVQDEVYYLVYAGKFLTSKAIVNNYFGMINIDHVFKHPADFKYTNVVITYNAIVNSTTDLTYRFDSEDVDKLYAFPKAAGGAWRLFGDNTAAATALPLMTTAVPATVFTRETRPIKQGYIGPDQSVSLTETHQNT
jgi:hypothetical protein